MMKQQDVKKITEALRIFILSLPFPKEYDKVIRNQLCASSIDIEQYCGCFKMLFKINKNVRSLPMTMPTLLQGGQIVKNSGPLSFQLFVENGYIVQFEVIDMGLNEIDWNYFFQHDPVFDIAY